MIVENINRDDTIDEQDLFVFALGYEPRCTHIAERISAIPGRKVAIGYDRGRDSSYQHAADRFRALGVEVLDNVSEETFARVARHLLQSTPAAKRIAVDVSSLNRQRIAAWVELLRRDFDVSYLYSPSVFVAPPNELTQNESIGPVSPFFSGDLLNPERPACAVLGLGYENGKALGAVEFLQCSDSWLFVPQSKERRFEEEVLRANALLIDQVSSERLLTYHVADPAGTYVDLCSLLQGISRLTNPVLLPLGPKLFALICMLASLRFPGVSVWRASGGRHEAPIHREADGTVVGVRARSGDAE